MKIPTIKAIDVLNKRVIVRADLDVDVTTPFEVYRLEKLLPTLQYLLDNKAKIIIIGHKGRPEGPVDESLSLEPVCQKLSTILGQDIAFVPEVLAKEVTSNLVMLENLRFDPREGANDEVFTKKLALLGEVYVNEAFANSHRNHASIVGLPKFLPHALGLRFEEEIKNLSRVFDNPTRPVVVILSGVKEDKLSYLEALKKIADKILIGGRLPEYLDLDKSVREYTDSDQVVVGNLVMDKEDITIHTIERFKEEIRKAGTLLLSGPLGRYEDEGHRQGTKEVFEAVVNSEAYKIIGGGDSLAVAGLLRLTDKFNWASVGGGATLEFIVNKTLPGIEALIG